MATAVAMMVGGAIVNALAFSGSNFLFHSLDKSKADVEKKRHDLAIEKLNEDTEKWSKDRRRKLDFINQELMKQNIAARDQKHMDDAMTLYSIYYPKSAIASASAPKPKLSDYYTVSGLMMKYEYLWIILGTTAVGFIVYKFV